jgi:hypothetical protein
MDIFDNPLFQLNEDDHEALSNEILMLRRMVSILQQENAGLHALKVQLQNSILLTQGENTTSIIKKKTREVSQETRAFMIFLNEQKNNGQFIEDIRTRMTTMGYNIHYRKNIPYQILKLECDVKYGQLSSIERKKYMDMAQHQDTSTEI